MGLSASNRLFLNKLNLGSEQKKLYDAYKKAANPDTPTIPSSTYGESLKIEKKTIEENIENPGKKFFG